MRPTLFADCAALTTVFPLVFIPNGATIFAAGRPARDIFLIVTGSVALENDPHARLRLIEWFREGDAIGLEALFSPSYAQTATAAETTLAYRIPAGVLRAMSEREPTIAVNVARIMHDRFERLRLVLPSNEC